MIKPIDKQLINLRKFNAYTYTQALKQLFLFPYDYFFNNGKSHAPLNIALFLTLRCNARCKMCNLQELLNKEKSELSIEEIDRFLKEIAPYKPSIILFGGEPLIRKDFLEILKKVKSYKLSCGIFTNGTLLEPKTIREMIRIGINFVAFSLQGIGKTHDDIVGLKGAYEKMIANIKEFSKYKNRKTKIILHTTISESNLDDFEEIMKLGKTLKVDLIRFGHPTFFTDDDIKRNRIVMKNIFPEEKMEEISYSYNPENKSNEYFEKITNFMKKHKNDAIMTPDLDFEEIRNWYSSNFRSKRKCFFVYRGVFIYPNGDVVPCESFKFKMGNIKEKRFMEIWNSEKFIKFRKGLKKGLYPACARCCKL